MKPETRLVRPDELTHEIRHRIEEGYSCRIAVAFLKTKGLDQLRVALRKAKGEIVVGASQFFITDWAALRQLWKIGKANPRLVVKRFFNAGFHPKIFYFEKGLDAQVILGSSNITGGGLFGNVEANISVKGAREDQLFVCTRNFLQRVFDYSKPLNREFVEEYRRESSDHRPRTPSPSQSDLKQDPLPKSPTAEVLPPRSRGPGELATWWKVAPGHDGSNWWRWKENITKMVGYISYGGSKYGSLRSLLSESKETALLLLEEKVRQTYPDSRPRQEALQLWRFGNGIKLRDVVVAYSQSNIYALGEIIGKYDYRPDVDQHYPHIRKVRWWALPNLRPPLKHLKILATNDTVHQITARTTTRYLRNLLEKRLQAHH
jgi:HKD family nuclease